MKYLVYGIPYSSGIDDIVYLNNKETEKADKISKEQNLLLLPPDIAEKHLSGDIHIHDMEYLGQRIFCNDYDLRYFFMGGFAADGTGLQTSFASPAKRAEVAILHAVKALASGQTNCAGGQGLYNFLTFISPYLEGLDYHEIKQLMQMVVYELTQVLVARGGQSCAYDTTILLRDKNGIRPRMIGSFCHEYLSHEGHIRIPKEIEALSLNRNTKKLEWKPVTNVYIHVPKEGLKIVKLETKEFVKVTQDHSLFTLDGDGNPVETTTKDNPKRILVARSMDRIDLVNVTSIEDADYSHDYVYDIGVADNENFVLLNGIIAHNTVFSSLQCSPGVPLMWRDVPVVCHGQLYDGRRIARFSKVKSTQIDIAGECDIGPIENQIQIEKWKFCGIEQVPLKTYGEYEREVRLAFKALMEIMYEGDARGRPFSFPKPEILIDKEFIDKNTWEEGSPSYKDLYYLAFKNSVTNGTPYFESHLFDKDNGVKCAQCCAFFFQSGPDMDPEFENKLRFKDGKHFSMGGWQVVTLNCPRAAYISQGNVDVLISTLKEWADLAVRVFRIKHDRVMDLSRCGKMTFLVQQLAGPDGKLMPALTNLEDLSYTIGVVGVNEMVEAMTGKGMHESDDSWKLAVRVMTELQIYIHELSARTGMTIAFARTPAETVAQRFAVCDLLDPGYRGMALKHVKGNIKLAMEKLNTTRDLPVEYTNGAMLAVDAPVSLKEKIRKESVFFTTFDGGNILNIYVASFDPTIVPLLSHDESSEEITKITLRVMDEMIDLIQKYPVKYFTLTQDLCVCMDCNTTTPGIYAECPHCNSKKIDTISRITGYLQSTRGWNKGKLEELKMRHRYDVSRG